MEQTIESITSFFRSNISVKKYDGFYSIDMPMLNWQSDFIRFYMEEEGNNLIRLSDSRDTFESLASELLPGSSSLKKWEDMISASIDRFGASMDENHEINMAFPVDKIGVGCFMFGQALSSACSAVGSMVEVSRQKTRNIQFARSFRSDLDQHKCKYKENYVMQGNLLEYKYDYLVMGRQDSLIKIMSDTSESSKILTLLEWQDVIKEEDFPLYAITRRVDEPKTSIGKKISKAMDESRIICLSYEKDKKDIEKYIMATT